MSLPQIRLDKGLHVTHQFFRLDRVRWSALSPAERQQSLEALDRVMSAYSNPSNPRITSYVNVGGKADLVFMLLAADLVELSGMQRQVELSFPPGTLIPVYSYFSVTELPEYVTTEEDMKRQLQHQEKLEPGSPAFEKRLGELKARHAEYEHYRLYPELPDWEVMGFYPMNKKRQGADNWYSLDLAARKQLMQGHARVGRKYAGRITQLITGSTGIDDWEWGVTLTSHRVDALKEIVYEMRFDEVSARYGEFGPFYINIRLSPAQIWDHLSLA